MLKKYRPLSLRLWHWSNSLAITLLLITVFLRKTFLSSKSIQLLILDKANALGIIITDSQAGDLARAIRNQMWQWHPRIGFVAIGLLVFRVLVFLMEKHPKTDEFNQSTYDKLVKKSHSLFYVLLSVMGTTGILLYWDEFFHLSESLNHLFKEIHENLLWFFLFFTVAHILGVVKAEFGKDRGIISEMINGGSKK